MDKLTLYEIYVIIDILNRELLRLSNKRDLSDDSSDVVMFDFYSNQIELLEKIINKFKEEE